MNQRQLEIFTTLAKTLNFSKTAERLHLSQTTVSLQIQSLERELNAKLFDRTSRTVQLTYAGNVFRESAEEILGKMALAASKTADAARGYTGHLKIGFADDIRAAGISTVLRNFSVLHPDIRVDMSGGYPTGLLEKLLTDEYDLIFTPSFRELEIYKLNYHVTGSCDTIAAFHRGHRFGQKEVLKFADFEGEDFIHVSGMDQELEFSKNFLNSLDQAGISVNIVARIDNIDTVFLMVASDMGVAVVPGFLKDNFFDTSEIRTASIEADLPPIRYLAVWKKGKPSEELNTFLLQAGYK